MSKVKRILSVIMAMVMVLAMSVPTFAGTVTPSKISIRVETRYNSKESPDEEKNINCISRNFVFSRFVLVAVSAGGKPVE